MLPSSPLYLLPLPLNQASFMSLWRRQTFRNRQTACNKLTLWKTHSIEVYGLKIWLGQILNRPCCCPIKHQKIVHLLDLGCIDTLLIACDAKYLYKNIKVICMTHCYPFGFLSFLHACATFYSINASQNTWFHWCSLTEMTEEEIWEFKRQAWGKKAWFRFRLT